MTFPEGHHRKPIDMRTIDVGVIQFKVENAIQLSPGLAEPEYLRDKTITGSPQSGVIFEIANHTLTHGLDLNAHGERQTTRVTGDDIVRDVYQQLILRGMELKEQALMCVKRGDIIRAQIWDEQRARVEIQTSTLYYSFPALRRRPSQ